MKYKDKGRDFCAEPGCISQEYGGEVDGLRFCPRHCPEHLSDKQYDFYCGNCDDINEDH